MRYNCSSYYVWTGGTGALSAASVQDNMQLSLCSTVFFPLWLSDLFVSLFVFVYCLAKFPIFRCCHVIWYYHLQSGCRMHRDTLLLWFSFQVMGFPFFCALVICKAKGSVVWSAGCPRAMWALARGRSCLLSFCSRCFKAVLWYNQSGHWISADSGIRWLFIWIRIRGEHWPNRVLHTDFLSFDLDQISLFLSCCCGSILSYMFVYHVSWSLIEWALIRDGFTLKGPPRHRAMPGAPESNQLGNRSTTPLSTSYCASLITRN